MSGGTVASGESSYVGAITTASTAETTTFADRFGYVAVTNLSSTAGQLLYVTADGSTPTGSGAGTQVTVAPGETRVVANGLPLWYPSIKVTQKGVNEFGGGNTTDSPASPGMVTPMEALAGQMANPGTKVSVLSATASLPYAIEGTG